MLRKGGKSCGWFVASAHKINPINFSKLWKSFENAFSDVYADEQPSPGSGLEALGLSGVAL